MADTEEDVMAAIAAGGDNAVATFVRMAQKFFERDGDVGLNAFVRRAFPTLPDEDKTAAMAGALGTMFLQGKKLLH